jgi:predicted HicB family RNase H-like nuclease
MNEGKTPEKPYPGRFNVRLNPEVHQRIVLEVARNGVSLNHWVAEV